jgi:hypothetical protein
MSERSELSNRDRELLRRVDELLSDGDVRGRELDSLEGFCAHLSSTVPEASEDFRRRLEARLVERARRNRLAASRELEPPRGTRGAGVLRRRLPSLAAALLLALILAGTVVYAASLLRVHPPEEPVRGGAAADIIVPPLLPPAGEERYRLMDPARAAEESGLPLAYLPQPPAGLDEVAVSLGAQRAPADAAEVSMAIRSLVRYRGGGHTLLVVLDEPSPGMALKHSLALGERTVRLPDGREAWAETHPEWPQANAVSTVVDRYVVVVASDLPEERVRELAGRVVVSPPSGAAAERGIPAGWPAPLAQEPASTADVVVTGDVDGGASGDRASLSFDLSIGNRGGRSADDVRVAVEFPRALRDRALEDYPGPPVQDMGPSERSGFGGEVAFDTSGMDPAAVRAALAEGIRVRVTWTDDGQPEQRVFGFR